MKFSDIPLIPLVPFAISNTTFLYMSKVGPTSMDLGALPRTFITIS